jgi:pimeloyl-ACP methyl ester carboxylesterase
MPTTDYQEQYVELTGAKIHYLKGGQGRPLVVLHSVDGNLGWQPYLRSLAEHHTVYALTLPGFGLSERPAWLETFPDLTRFTLWLLEALDLSRASFLGHFMGGWLAAEMAVSCPQIVDRLVLVSAAGIRPKQGEITDIFLYGQDGARKISFFNPEQTPAYKELFGRKLSPEEREQNAKNQENTIRYCWKPYMHDAVLPVLLPRVQAPALIVWGKEDRIIPLECGELYRQALRNAQLKVFEQCGHYPHLEKPEEFGQIVSEFLLKG